jgi:hypothetical protein
MDAFLGQFDRWSGDSYVVGNRLPGDVASYPNKTETAKKTRPKKLPFLQKFGLITTFLSLPNRPHKYH